MAARSCCAAALLVLACAALLAAPASATAESAISSAEPWAEHIALGPTGSGIMSVMWMTNVSTPTFVRWGHVSGNYTQHATGTASTYLWIIYTSPYIHVANITGLQPGDTIYYQVGDGETQWGTEYSFHMPPSSSDPSPLYWTAFGDQGHTVESWVVYDAQLSYAKANLPSGAWDLLTLSGDISYANSYQPIWDQYQQHITPFAATVPMMMTVGNHELLELLVAFQNRWTFPGNGYDSTWRNLFYSFDYQHVHFVMLDSETPFYVHDTPQFEWLVADLKSVDRSVTPWVVAMWHSPWYTSNEAHADSGYDMRSEFEATFHQFQVDLVVNGHVHAYERTFPVYNNTVATDGTVYLTVGTGGNQEGLYRSWTNPQPAWSAHRESNYGFMAFTVNATHLQGSFIRAINGTVGDELLLTKQ